VFEIDLKDRTVFQVGGLIHARSRAFVLSDKKYIYSLGGEGFDGPNSSLFEKYDPETKLWTELSRLNRGFEPNLCMGDKHFISVFSKSSQSFMKYVIQDNKWVEESGTSIPKDLYSYTNVCLANQSKFSLLGRAVRESSNVELLCFDHLTNKVQKHSQLSVLNSWLPIILIPNDNLHLNNDDRQAEMIEDK
jgi:Kelch motif